MISLLQCITRYRNSIIFAVAAQSVLLGIAMLFQPVRFLALTGWEYDGPVFFLEQSGIFLLILGCGYFWGLKERSMAWFLVFSKALAVVFLLTEYATGHAPASILMGALNDGGLGLLVALSLLDYAKVPTPAQTIAANQVIEQNSITNH